MWQRTEQTMSGTIEEPAKLENPPGIEHLIEAELTRLAANPKFGQLVRGELAWRRFQNRETLATPPARVFEVKCRGCGNKFEVCLRLPDGGKFSADSPFSCKGCSGDQSIVDSPTGEIEKQLEGKSSAQQHQVRKSLASARKRFVRQLDGTFTEVDDYDPNRREQVRQTAREWRKNNPERAAENKRRNRQGISYRESRKELMSDAAWEDKLKEFGYACSTPGCRRPLNLKTAIRAAEGPTYVPVCRSCQARRAAMERWMKEKNLEKAK